MFEGVLFEENLQRAEHVKNINIITVQRNEEESISSMLSGLELKEDVDEESKKWFNKYLNKYLLE